MILRTVHVVETGVANLASVRIALARAGGECHSVRAPSQILDAEHVVLPGVGSFGTAMDTLRASGLVEALRNRILLGRPTLAICLGLQILCEGSEEAPGVVGLGVVRSVVRRLPSTVRVPQMGWNRVVSTNHASILSTGYAYFANSYCLTDPPGGWTVSLTNHGGPFVSALERDRVLACQFHPELSGQYGARLLRCWLQGREGEASSC